MSYEEFFKLREQPFSTRPTRATTSTAATTGRRCCGSSTPPARTSASRFWSGTSAPARRRWPATCSTTSTSASSSPPCSSSSTLDHGGWLLRKIAAQLGVEAVPADKVEILAAIYHRLLAIKEEGARPWS